MEGEKKHSGGGRLEYFLACFPSKPIKLEPGRVYSLGRGEGNSIVLPEQDVSRKHALITWDGAQFVLKDLGASNGTYLNRRRVTEAALKDDDKIGVGGRIFTFMARTEKSVNRLLERAEALREKGKTQMLDATKLVPGQGLAGSLSDFGLSELLQTMEINRKSGRLRISFDSGKGEVFVRDGQVVRAELAGLAGEEAVYAMMKIEEGYFEFEAKEFEVETNTEDSTAAILMEGFRRIDESGGRREAAEEASEASGAVEGTDLDRAEPGGI